MKLLLRLVFELKIFVNCFYYMRPYYRGNGCILRYDRIYRINGSSCCSYDSWRELFTCITSFCLFGAILLLWADIAARTIMAPEDMPIGIVTGLVGGVFFVYLLRRKL